MSELAPYQAVRIDPPSDYSSKWFQAKDYKLTIDSADGLALRFESLDDYKNVVVMPRKKVRRYGLAQLTDGSSVFLIEMGSKSFFGAGKIMLRHIDVEQFDAWFRTNISRKQQQKKRLQEQERQGSVCCAHAAASDLQQSGPGLLPRQQSRPRPPKPPRKSKSQQQASLDIPEETMPPPPSSTSRPLPAPRPVHTLVAPSSHTMPPAMMRKSDFANRLNKLLRRSKGQSMDGSVSAHERAARANRAVNQSQPQQFADDYYDMSDEGEEDAVHETLDAYDNEEPEQEDEEPVAACEEVREYFTHPDVYQTPPDTPTNSRGKKKWHEKQVVQTEYFYAEDIPIAPATDDGHASSAVEVSNGDIYSIPSPKKTEEVEKPF